MKNSMIILAFFVAGVGLGIGELLPDVVMENDFSMYALYVLMFLVGVGIGADKKSWSVLRSMNLKIVLIPVGIIVGTLLGTAATSFLLNGVSLKEAMAVGAGFGYYSLSSIFITQISGETLGVTALLANILREIITLLGTPLLVNYFGKIAGIASGGATSMDTTLPIIVKYSGKEWAIISVFSGIVLTVLVPFLVTFILEFF
ncbi:lysine exporter LysO family protein [Prolixibacteraceae bacterium JC049]|nr:lysine exporter LysO family protein [Prolixibacteraceae bacterium JC049]